MPAQLDKPIRIFQPPSPNYRTGGYIYNQRMAAQIVDAQVQTIPAVQLPQNLAASAGAHLLVDSLYLRDDVALVALRRHDATLLIHGLSSLVARAATATQRSQWARELNFLEAGRRIIVTSNFMADLLRARAPHLRVDACPPGVDDIFSQLRPQPLAHPPIVITIANVVSNKGYLEQVPAMAELAGRATFHWDIVGDLNADMTYADKLRAALDAYGLSDHVTLHGSLDRPRQAAILETASVHFFPSKFETFGMAAIESLAAGVPVVASSLGELGRLVTHGELGLLAHESDPQALVLNLERILSDHALRSRLRKATQARRGSWSRWPDAAARLREVLQRG